MSWRHVVFIVALGMIVFNFLFNASYQQPSLKAVFSGFLAPLFFMSAILGALFAAGFAISALLKDEGAAWPQCLLVLSPIALLFLWPAQETGLSPWIPLGIIGAASIMMFRTLTRAPQEKKRGRPALFLTLLIAGYFLFFTFLGMEKFNALQLFNPKDWAVYDQIFWNTLRGALFSSSFYGSNLAGHNTWFFFLLVPFYALNPHPWTLLVLKTLLLSLSAVPFYKVAKDILKEEPPLACILCFLFFPFLVAQNLNAPHEMGYAPFFILWTYYFYRTGRFLPFLGFLLVLLSIKEHLAALAVGFGLYAILEKKGRRWVLTPVVLGVLWGIFSLASMAYFKKIYQPQSDPSWFLTAFHHLYLSDQGGFLSFFAELGKVLSAAMILILPLGVVPPLISGISLLGLPEVCLNMLAQRPVLFSPFWHYNVVSSCFFLMGALEGIRKIAGSRWAGRFKLKPAHALPLLAWLLLAMVMIHSYTWLDLVRYKKETAYLTAVREAIAAVPRDAFLTVPVNVAPWVSGRENLALLEEGGLGDYVLLDRSGPSGVFPEKVRSHYQEIFRKKEISVHRKML